MTSFLAVIFMDLPLEAKTPKAKINKWDYIKLKSFCRAKKTIDRMKRQSLEWEKIFSNHISNKDPVFKINKECLQVNNLEEETATHSSILAWRIPWTEEPGGLPSVGSHRVRHD